MRIGSGFDVHAWAPDRPLWLGGVRFDGEAGLAGHSDGDVVCHAIADALLGALALGDVGQRFPDTDPAVAGITGERLLARTCELVLDTGHRPSTCDVTVVCDRPAIAPRRDEMRRALARIVGLPLDRMSVKATRPEGLGLVGDGVGCLAIATVVREAEDP
ncbi:MAG TPA: 2-C-methyl-D-erythritol 2,4-cyclodiphosphate synthase [Actinomycetota bacterium]|nr:2-C-methyl-D-erythritol 2,4-cyclodiphosphate synthase [Actinomycetota bacterium]